MKERTGVEAGKWLLGEVTVELEIGIDIYYTRMTNGKSDVFMS